MAQPSTPLNTTSDWALTGDWGQNMAVNACWSFVFVQHPLAHVSAVPQSRTWVLLPRQDPLALTDSAWLFCPPCCCTSSRTPPTTPSARPTSNESHQSCSNMTQRLLHDCTHAANQSINPSTQTYHLYHNLVVIFLTNVAMTSAVVHCTTWRCRQVYEVISPENASHDNCVL